MRTPHSVILACRRAFGACAIGLGLLACSSALRAQSDLAESRAGALGAVITGSWKATIGRESVVIDFLDGKRYRTPAGEGSYSLNDAGLTLTDSDGNATTFTVEYVSGVLTVSGGDLKQATKFTRNLSAETPLHGFFRATWNVSSASVRDKAVRIGSVLIIILAAVWIIRGLRAVSSFLIFSQWGLLKFIYRRHKNRTRTVHSVVLNLLKYIIVFAAMGRILGELGVNYTTYIASLSVVGLAVGFGSQGLVQDLVTGLFLILDSQVEVGHMVEISGQTGIVEELGLRTMRVRNYLGQTVIIPNRNIALVGNYHQGHLAAVVDVAVKNEKDAMVLRRRLEIFGAEVAKQFAGTILETPEMPRTLKLDTGECFVRIIFALWPQQQAIVESQLVPRIREIATGAEVEIPSNRVTVFFRLPEAVKLSEHTFRMPRILRRREPARPAPRPADEEGDWKGAATD